MWTLEGAAGAPPCDTVTLLPAIVSVAERVEDDAADENATLPGPVPAEPLVIVSQVALLAAVHGQPAVAVTVIEPVPPPLERLTLVGETANEHAV